eukprot:CAMPEP_0174374204 /NCGR_PEP_ID=MMETSP0811_2-20130205/110070_1 /TAXON_ID=73025 ORGANISM="Eutreptiella gymnastica-like, Strain CCMP1594" /NCGR_SAMPLE_ID=MMETSP0811_2 /ASSEMBLY_ACC=CAM_ASM_000667 /LENGTH=156 /DNA_ID=CAMNT_0015523321 /DNA_START=92 /DNA_END=562 /DNA_ORIENTATION=-
MAQTPAHDNKMAPNARQGVHNLLRRGNDNLSPLLCIRRDSFRAAAIPGPCPAGPGCWGVTADRCGMSHAPLCPMQAAARCCAVGVARRSREGPRTCTVGAVYLVAADGAVNASEWTGADQGLNARVHAPTTAPARMQQPFNQALAGAPLSCMASQV